MRCVRKFRSHSSTLRQLLRFCSGKGADESKKCADLKASTICKDKINGSEQKCDSDKKEEKKNKSCSSNGSGSGKDKNQKVTMIMGDGVGPELMESVKKVCKAANVSFEWEIIDCYMVDNEKLNPELVESLQRNKVGIKGPMSALMLRALYKAYGLYAHVAICRNMEGLDSRYGHLDCVVIRDVMEGEYSGIEHSVVPGILQSIKVSTSVGAQRIAQYVFQFAMDNDRSKITVAHKANIMKLTDGNFLTEMRAEAHNHMEKVQFEERYMDTACLELIMYPEQSDVLVSSSMYGDVLVVIASSITGGKPLCPGFCLGKEGVVFDSLIKANPELAGKDVINPTGMLLSTALMLKHLKLDKESDKVKCAVEQVYKDSDLRTSDLGGTTSTTAFTDAVCANIAKS